MSRSLTVQHGRLADRRAGEYLHRGRDLVLENENAHVPGSRVHLELH